MKMRQKSIKRRDDFYTLILQAIRSIVLGKESELLLFNIWGPHGSGKTYALNEITNKVKELASVIVLGPFDISEHNHKLLDKIVEDVNETSQQYKKIILLDNLKSIISTGQDDVFIYDVEEKLISPIMSNGDSIIVVTSLHEIKQWRSVEVRARQKTILIPPISAKAFKTAVKTTKLNYATTFEKVLGHPKLLEWLKENPDLNIDELDEMAIDFFLNGLEPESKKIAQVMSLSFSFNVPAYQKALNVAGLKVEAAYFSDLKKIKEMGSLGLIIYESSSGMYRFSDPLLREVLARSYRREFPGVAENIYRALAELSIYETKFTNSLPSHLLNAIYYQLRSSKLSGLSFSKWLDEWFSDMKDNWKGINWNEVDRAITQNLSSKYILQEIKQLAGPEIYKKVVLKIHPNRRIEK